MVKKLTRVRVPLATFRNRMSRYLERVLTKGVVIEITKHGRGAAIAILPEDLYRLERLIALLTKRANEAIEKQIEGEVDEARKLREENQQIAELVKRALRQTVDGDSTLLHDMARKYLDL